MSLAPRIIPCLDVAPIELRAFNFTLKIGHYGLEVLKRCLV